MTDYNHILLAVDFSDHGKEVAKRAFDVSKKYDARLSMVHTVEYIPQGESPYGIAMSYDFNLTEQVLQTARKRLATVGEKFSVPPENQWLEVGSPKLEIVRTADEHKVDLIVVGSHGAHGLAGLLGSTASGVLHHAKCDVLAVRWKSE